MIWVICESYHFIGRLLKLYTFLYLKSHRKIVRLGEYDTETNPDCIINGDDRDCNETPFDTAPESKFYQSKSM